MIVCATNLSFTKLNFSNFVKTVTHIGFTNIEVAQTSWDKEQVTLASHHPAHIYRSGRFIISKFNNNFKNIKNQFSGHG